MLKCDHCLLEFPEREAVRAGIDGREKVFCCNGCKGIFRLIHEEGLDDFYSKRVWKETGPGLFQDSPEIELAPFEENIRSSDSKCEIDLSIEGIRCASCVWLNERILMKTRGVEKARVNYGTHRARILFDPDIIGLRDILKRITSIGYRPKPYSESEQIKGRREEKRDLLIRFGTAAFLSSQIMLYSIALYAGYFQGMDPSTKLALEVIEMFLTVPIIFYSGMPFLRGTMSGLRHLHFTMDSLIAIGSGSAFIYSIYAIMTKGEVFFDTASMIITLILLGRYLETVAKGKASETISRLMELAPRMATVVSGDILVGDIKREKVEVKSLKKSDMIEVKPGEKIPIDGIVVSGESEADESLLTGESKPVRKEPGDMVIGGSINLFGNITFSVTNTGKETVLASIIGAVEEAQAGKPRIQKAADKAVGIFVPLILVIACATVAYYFSRSVPAHIAIMNGISVLVISCPCSLGLATPLAVMVFTALASSRGVLIRGGEVIENAGRVDHIVFDKTGTITIGRPVLKATVLVESSYSKEYIEELASSLEKMSEHSIGQAISKIKGRELEVKGFKTFPGSGVSGIVDGKRIFIGNIGLMRENGLSESALYSSMVRIREYEESGDTVVYIGMDGKVMAFMVIADVIRDEVPAVVKELNDMGLRISMLSGDNERTCRAIAGKAGIEDAVSDVSPVRKKEEISSFRRQGKKTMMVGDGINDAPALAEAAVGVGMGRGTDIAIESSDAVLVRNDLRLVPWFIKLSRMTYSIIRQNIFWAFFYNVIAIPMAVAGLLHPIIAAAAMAASSLFVVGNSLRIRT